jgi:hypothetical protein
MVQTTTQRIAGLVRSDGEGHQRAARLNRLMISMNSAAVRAEFAADPQVLMERHQLNAAERALLMDQNWQGLLEYGVSVYALAKMSRAFHKSLFDIGASMRGCSVPELQGMLPVHHLNKQG